MKSDESLHELTGVGMAPVSDTISRGWNPVERVQGKCVQESTLARRLLRLLAHRALALISKIYVSGRFRDQ